jgi:Xaa-Pro aminopeptidase
MGEGRINHIKRILREDKLGGILITNLENIRYLSGFTGSDAALVITKNKGYFLTDSRYTTQAGKEVLGFEVVQYKKKIEGLFNLMNQLGLEQIGFEAQNLSFQAYKELAEKVSGGELIPINERMRNIRAVKDDEEIGLIKKAIDIASKSLTENVWRVTPGNQEREVALELEFSMRRNGADNIAFDTIVVSGDRSALPHGRPSQKKIHKGDLVIIDFGVRYGGYYSDETRTFISGKPNRRQKEVYRIVKDAHDKAVSSVRPGMKAVELDAVARGWIKDAGYGDYFGHGTGHGVGLAVHEDPVIGPESEDVVEEGMVFTIEPGIYIPGWGGVRIEDMVLVTENGCEVLTDMSKEIGVME